ncbi:secretin [Pseudomonas sp. WN033]|nr:secretin [Pseudomonas sp. WN033]
MSKRIIGKAFRGVSTACALVLAGPVLANNPCVALQEAPGVLEVGYGMQHEVQLPVPITRLAVGNPEVAEVRLTGRQSFLITTTGSGVTNISVWTRCAAAPRQSMLFVQGEAVSALAHPVQSVQDERDLPSQVQTDIRFVEVNRSKLKAMGVSLLGTGSGNFLFGSPGASPGSVPIGGVGNLTPGLNLPLPDTGFNIVWGGGSSRVLGALNALENSGFAYTLARPSLVALSGQSASFLAGGEFPVPVPSSGSDSVSIQYKEFGVRLSLTPTVVGRDRITLKVAPEVSELDFNSGISIEGITVPALNVRRTDTSVSLADGESFVISGLISTRSASAVDKLPGLGDLPILGAFFRSSRIDREERELLMVVTPRLVQPLAANAQLPELPGESLRRYDPSAFELLLFENGEFDQRRGLTR